MNLNRIELSKIQGLLVQLVQIFEPLAKPGNNTSISFLNNRFFIPPNDDSHLFRFKYPVVYLKTTLDTAQEQVSEWIERLPQTKESTSNKREEMESKPVLPSGKGEKISLGEPKPPPVSMQAQRFVNQVRDAIGNLCSSSNITDPKAAPLREALLRIKPLLDEIIKAVSQDGMHSADDEPNPHFRFTIPRTARNIYSESRFLCPKVSLEKKLQNRSARNKSQPFYKSRLNQPKPLKKGEKGLLKRIPLPSEKTPLHRENKAGQPRPIDRIALPGAPFNPETRSLAPARKKKKRKGFWFRDDDEKEPSS